MSLKLFMVEMFYTDPELSMLLTYGGHSGGIHTREAYICAESAEEAISRQWEKEIKAHEEQIARNADILKRKSEGKALEVERLLVRRPSSPVNREKWRVSEILVQGYKISITEDTVQGDEK
jgi:hypothetical protein